MKKYKNILIIANTTKLSCFELLSKIENFLTSKAIAYRVIKEQNFELDSSEIFDLALTLGGDGTVLQAAHKIINREIPILALNFGHLGFFTAYEGEEHLKALSDLLNNNLVIKKFSTLQVEVWRNDCLINSSIAINDAVIANYIHHRLISYGLSIDGYSLDFLKSDAFIVSSTIGSTAYATSAGGPIVNPDVNVLVLVPVCPFILAVRPFIVPSSSIVEILIASNQRTEVSLNLDGEFFCKLEERDIVKISEYKHSLHLLRPKNYPFYAMVKNKLGWKGSV